MNRVKVIIGIILLAIVLAMWFTSSRGGTPVQTATVTQGSISEFIDERGKTRLPREYKITVPFTGRIDEITLREGDAVKQGQVVAQMSADDLANAVAEANAEVERLEASIAENNDNRIEEKSKLQATDFVLSMQKTVEAAEARVDAGEERFGYATRTLERILRLRQSNAATQDAEDAARLAKVEADVNYRQDKLVLESLRAILSATVLLPNMVSDYILRKDLTAQVLAKQKAESEARLRQVLTQQERGTIKSPVDGTILERINHNEQHLPGGTELMTIGQLSELEIEADILSQDVVEIEPGDSVEVYGPAVGAPVGRGVRGVVQQIYPAGFSKISSLGVEQQRVKVIIKLSSDALYEMINRKVGVGFRVRVRITTDQKSDALVLPRTALFRSPDNHWQVYVVQRRTIYLKTIETGLMNDEVAEVVDGLSAGDVVVLAPENSLTEGTRVNPLAVSIN